MFRRTIFRISVMAAEKKNYAAEKKNYDPRHFQPNVISGQASNQVRFYSEESEAPIPRISEAIKKDHREIEAYYESIVNSNDPDEQTKYQNQFTWELARHSIGEELVVYPAFEKYLKDGGQLAEKDRGQHQSVKEQLAIFQDLKSTDPRFLPTIKSLMEDLRQHIKEEETNDMVKLDEVLSREESTDLSKSFDRTKMFVPSRSHPMAPEKPPFETAVGLLTAPIDRLSDMFRKWPK